MSLPVAARQRLLSAGGCHLLVSLLEGRSGSFFARMVD
ncbi:hypothetical protein SACS_0577 [Parasaccharibacter apium]|uniref:Uncharacterized protein n=1 Tax=Parasaccharibacter apium TaxID=1510841 RepID=A0A7U7G5A8_9PROT|nr:hypothetical protein SACS_0577 [Parasaccharibacter apium]